MYKKVNVMSAYQKFLEKNVMIVECKLLETMKSNLSEKSLEYSRSKYQTKNKYVFIRRSDRKSVPENLCIGH